MPWKEVRPMDQKVMFIADFLRKQCSFTALCAQFGISRKTGYKWLKRYQAFGSDGLQDQSRQPGCIPHKTPYAVRQEIIRVRKAYRDPPGAKKIRILLEQQHPDWYVPSITTIHCVLKAEGLVKPRRRRRRVPRMGTPFASVHGPNEVWSADFKGQFKTRDGKWCFPLTVMDHSSRYLLGCRIVSGTSHRETCDVFVQLFSDYGMPYRIRTDNGVPFASLSVGGISQLSAWWVRLGIFPERIRPGQPQENGQHERMHRTLKKSTVCPPAANREEQQQRFDEFQKTYNEERPHESLGQMTPESVYTRSGRVMPMELRELEYPGHYRVCLVNHNGVVNVNAKRVYVSGVLKGEHIGMEETGDGQWEVHFGPVRLGRFDERDGGGVSGDYIRLQV